MSSRSRPSRSRRSSRSIEELVDRGLAYESTETSIPCRPLSGVRTALAAAPGRDGQQETNPRKEEPAGLRALEGGEAGRGHVMGFAVGTGPARLAHRVLRDGGEASRGGVRHPRRRDRPRLPPSRERARAVRGAGHDFARSGCTTACSSSSARRCRSRSATSCSLRQAIETWGRETMLVYFLTGHWRKPIDYHGRRP